MNELINRIKCYSVDGVTTAKIKFDKSLFLQHDCYEDYTTKYLVVGKDKNLFRYKCKNKHYHFSKITQEYQQVNFLILNFLIMIIND